MANGWDKFWKGQRYAFGEIMRINTDFFGKQLERECSLTQDTRILDYGCGPGYLADYLAGQGIRVTGADINEFFVVECRAHHPEGLFITITTDPDRNRDILQTSLRDCQFDCIVLLSIAQYFENLAVLEQVIGRLLPLLAPNGKIVIADVVDEKTSSVSDALSLFRHCVRRGKILRFVRFIAYLLFSDYRQISRSAALLKIPDTAMAHIATLYQLHYRKVNGLTIHATRTNYVLTSPAAVPVERESAGW